ncbi:hypothetical protein H6804_00135 [Candidatus Nomurabacteria bacterium]|nr:hypothetical protein [Candidatus Nomurabacteria bacterium]
MSKSFGIVEYKLTETEFFLDKIINTEKKQINWHEMNFYFSAFLTSARSITFAIQVSINGDQDLIENYKEEQDKLKQNPEARFFVEARNLSEKVGYYPIRNGCSKINDDGEREMLWYFDIWNEHALNYMPDEDVITVSKRFFVTLLKMVQSFYVRCGDIIDSEKYYTLENLQQKGISIEDVEEELGFPRGWAKLEGVSDKERINQIRDSQRVETPDWIFDKYLRQNRFGEPLND